MNGRWTRTQAVLVRRLGAGVLLLPRRADAPFLLTGAGVDVWDRLAEPASFDQVVGELVQRYDMAEPVVTEALDPVMRELAGRGAIVPAEPADRAEPDGSNRAEPDGSNRAEPDGSNRVER
jgi:hypothetical protein